MSIIQISDFKGEYKIATDCFSDLSDYITTYEKYYLVRLLGADLYNLFIADLTPTTPQIPQTARFLNIFNPFDIDKDNSLYTSEGIKQTLIQLIYFHITRDIPNAKTASGTVRMANESSENNPYNGFNLTESYNKGIENYTTITWYICDNDQDYPEYNGIHLTFSSGI